MSYRTDEKTPPPFFMCAYFERSCNPFDPAIIAEAFGGKVVFVNGFNVVTELKSGAVIVSSPKTFLNTFKPIETPEEKAERLRSEWCSECTSKYYPRGHKGFPEMIYDALLSGELEVPKEVDQS